MSGALFASGPHIEIFGDALYWTVGESIDWIVSLKQGTHDGFTSYKTLTFNWDVGFRAGIGYSNDRSLWETQLYYTHFSTKTEAHAKVVEGEQLVPTFLGNRTASDSLFTFNYAFGKASWNLAFDIADWDVRRRIPLSQAFMICPSIGLKGGTIKQHIYSKWYNPHLFIIFGPLSATENLKNDFAGIGPKGGVDLKWTLGSLISLFGDFSGAYLWGKWTIKDHYKNSHGEKAIVTVGKRKFGSPVFRAFLGLMYDHPLRRDQSHLSVQLGYEIQDWLNQFQIFDNGTGGNAGDLVLQGVTGRFQFQF